MWLDWQLRLAAGLGRRPGSVPQGAGGAAATTDPSGRGSGRLDTSLQLNTHLASPIVPPAHPYSPLPTGLSRPVPLLS